MNPLLSTLSSFLSNTDNLNHDFVNIIAQSYGYESRGNFRNNYDDDDDDDEYNGSQQSSKYLRNKNKLDRNINNDNFASKFQLVQNPRQIGAALIGIGILLTVMGMMLFFEGNLLRLGNISIITGIPFLIGTNRIRKFFLKPERAQATIITTLGIILVFIGKPRLGILCEVFGLLNLFGNMFPLLFAIGRRMPIVGDIIGAFDGSASKKRYKPEL